MSFGSAVLKRIRCGFYLHGTEIRSASFAAGCYLWRPDCLFNIYTLINSCHRSFIYRPPNAHNIYGKVINDEVQHACRNILQRL
jgi:hypothetical protein